MGINYNSHLIIGIFVGRGLKDLRRELDETNDDHTMDDFEEFVIKKLEIKDLKFFSLNPYYDCDRDNCAFYLGFSTKESLDFENLTIIFSKIQKLISENEEKIKSIFKMQNCNVKIYPALNVW